MSGPVIYLAGGVWPVADPQSLPGRGQTPWEFAADCLDRSARVFAEYGVTREQMLDPDGPAQGVADECGPESREAVALSLWSMAKSGQATLSMASRGNRSSPASVVEALAGVFVNLGMLRLIFDSMAPAGIAARAVIGDRAQSQRKDAAAKAGGVSKRKDWHAEAEKIWSAEPLATHNSVATRVATQFGAEKSSVMRSIKPLIPRTSPSFKAG